MVAFMAKSSYSIKADMRTIASANSQMQDECSVLRTRIEKLDKAIECLNVAKEDSNSLKKNIRKMDRQPQWIGANKNRFETGCYSPLMTNVTQLFNNIKDAIAALKRERNTLQSKLNSLTKQINSNKNKLRNLEKDLKKAQKRESNAAKSRK